MVLLYVGLALFVGVHLLPSTPLRSAIVNNLGGQAYKVGFALLSIAGLVLIVIGYRQAPVEYVFEPKEWARAAAVHTMPLVFIMLAASNMPTHIRRWLRHPMSIATLIWALLHYFANGERTAVWLFGSIAVFAAISIVSGSLRGQQAAGADKPVAWKYDLMAVVGGVVVYAAVLFAHGWLFNRPLIG